MRDWIEDRQAIASSKKSDDHSHNLITSAISSQKKRAIGENSENKRWGTVIVVNSEMSLTQTPSSISTHPAASFSNAGEKSTQNSKQDISLQKKSRPKI